MGGGAGIQWEMTFDSVYAVYHPYSKKSKLQLTETPKLLYFSAQGYMDGMDEVRGDLLEVTDFEAVVDVDLKNYWYPQYMPRAGDQLLATVPTVKFMIYGGYIRGDIHKTFPYTVEGKLRVDGDEEMMSWSAVLQPTDDFFDWYEDVFECYDCPDYQWSDNRLNYGYEKEKKHATR